MTELQALLDAIARMPAGRPGVLATLMKVAGSAYRGPGARMLVMPDLTTVGAISGGCLEKDVAARAQEVQATGIPTTASYDLTKDDDAPWGLGLGCAAALEVLLEPCQPGSVPEHLAFIRDAQRRREPAVLATLFRAPHRAGLRAGARLLLGGGGTATGDLVGGALEGPIRADAERVLRQERSAATSYPLSGGEAEALIEFIPRPIALVICGGGADTAPLAEAGARLGWQVRLVGKDDPLGQLDERTAAVVMTHNYPRDLALLEALLRSQARYIGMLGPRQRTRRLIAELKKNGHRAGARRPPRLHAPAGLDLGAETPAEIALSIAGEIRAVMGGRSGGMLRDRKGPIHDRR